MSLAAYARGCALVAGLCILVGSSGCARTMCKLRGGTWVGEDEVAASADCDCPPGEDCDCPEDGRVARFPLLRALGGRLRERYDAGPIVLPGRFHPVPTKPVFGPASEQPTPE